MKRLPVFILITLFVLAASSTFSQTGKGGKDPKKDLVKKEETKKTEAKKEEKKGGTNVPDGYGGMKWGEVITKAKDQVAGKIVFMDKTRSIVTRDGEMEYLYGFFYADPAMAQGGQPASEARLFYVAVQFPYLPMDQVRKKIEERYGPPNGENIKDNQGALVWDSAKTTVIMWVDRYEKKPFCRKINYVGKDLAREINEYQAMIFNKTELEILKKLNP